MTTPTVLITGAGGFVGGALVSGFADLGWEVVAVDRAFDTTPASGGVRSIVVDLGVSQADLPGVDLVIHAAWVTADPSVIGLSEDAYLELNLRPLLSMIQYAKAKRPVTFVFVSSSGVFAATDGADGLHAECRPSGSSAYAKAKLMAERLTATELGAMTNVRLVRLGYLYGPGESARASRPGVSLVARWLASARRGEPLEVRADDPKREWTFAADLAPVLAGLVRETGAQGSSGSATGPIHLGSPHVVHDSELAEMVAGHFAGLEVTTGPAGRPVKPPMVASDLPTIRDFEWTDLRSGLSALAAAGADS